MRVILRYCLPWGNFLSQVINIDKEYFLENLQTTIFEKFQISFEEITLKIHDDDYIVCNK